MDDDCQVLNEENPSIHNDDDPLIAEVDIYLTRLFADQLYLFQYPLRSKDLQFDSPTAFVGARLKPKNKLVQLDYQLDRQSNFHCENREHRIAENWSSTTNETSDSTPSIDRLTFSSSNATLEENYKRFAVGMLTPNGIQLSPLNAVFQLRPDFDLTSKALAQQTIPMSDDEDEETEGHPRTKQNSTAEDSATEEDQAFKLVTMKFWRPEGRLERERKLRSYKYRQRALQEERWIEFAYYSPHEIESIELRQKWIIHDRSGLPIRWRKTISIDNYFQLLLLNEGQISWNNSMSIESNSLPSIEQKPSLLPPPTKSKKNNKIKAEKKTPKKNRNSNRTTSTSEPKQVPTTSNIPLSSVSLPNTTLIKQDPEKTQNELLNFMKRRFAYRPYFKFSEINIAIKLELIESPPGHPLATGVTEASILRAATEIGAVYINKKWPKNLKQEPVFINTQMGDKYDTLRRYVVNLLEKCDSFQFTELRARIKQENQTQLYPIQEVKKFVKDHCVPRSTRRGVLYYVKGTLVK